jgi:putative heme degradation protein
MNLKSNTSQMIFVKNIKMIIYWTILKKTIKTTTYWINLGQPKLTCQTCDTNNETVITS